MKGVSIFERAVVVHAVCSGSGSTTEKVRELRLALRCSERTAYRWLAEYRAVFGR